MINEPATPIPAPKITTNAPVIISNPAAYNNGTTTTNNGIVCSHIPHTVPQIDKIKVNNGTKIISLPFIFINNLPIPASSALVLLTKTIIPFIDNKKIVILAVPFLNGRWYLSNPGVGMFAAWSFQKSCFISEVYPVKPLIGFKNISKIPGTGHFSMCTIPSLSLYEYSTPPVET